MRAGHLPAVVVAAALLQTVLAAQDGAQRSPLTAAPQLARAYDAILDARFDEVPHLLDATCHGREPHGAGPVRPSPALRRAASPRAGIARIVVASSRP